MRLYPDFKILIVDDEELARYGVESALLANGITNVQQVEDPEKVFDLLRLHKAKIVLLDLMMPNVSGEDILARIKEEHPDVTVIMVTGKNEVDSAVRCMKLGAYDYLLKPIEYEILIASVNRAVGAQELSLENMKVNESVFKTKLQFPEAFQNIVSANKTMFSIFKYVEAVAPGNQPILINGETGTGKELLAQAIHQVQNCPGKFVAVNTAEIEPAMMSDTLFGHMKGAYTGADSRRAGLLESSNDGTLFLDEIGDLSKEVQAKLLRVLQEREYTPLGSDTPKKCSARIITATHQNLEKMVEEGKFRRDLYFRLKTHKIQLPSLRDRKDDIPLLLRYFAREAAREFKKTSMHINPDLPKFLECYDFPGNIREMRGLVFDAVGRCDTEVLGPDAFDGLELPEAKHDPESQENDGFLPLKDAVREHVLEALKLAGGNQSSAAKLLGISHQALSKRLKNLDNFPEGQ